MKKFLLVFICVLLVLFGSNYYLNTNKNKSISLTLPLPFNFTILKNPQVSTLDIWDPRRVFGQNMSLNITGKSALAYDLTTNKVLFIKNPNQRLPMASLTKIMTAIVALEHPLSSDQYLVKKQYLVGEDSMGLSSGEILSLKELLYGLVLHSGNDAAETLAGNFSGGRNAFIKAMNEKALSLGLNNTHFTNPTGLEGDGDQYTTAYDLLIETRYALKNFLVLDQVVATFDHNIYATSFHKAYYLENETNLLTSYPGVMGVKDGYTPQAGLCLVTYLDYKGHKIIAVLLGSDDRRGEMKEILDYSLKEEGVIPPKHG